MPPESTRYPPPPPRLHDEPLLRRTLHGLLDKLERGVKPQLKVTPKEFPELFDFLNPDANYLWSLLEQLDHKYHLLTIGYGKRGRQQEKWEAAHLRLNPTAEPVLRAWLKRPARDGYSLLWQALVERHGRAFDDGGAALGQAPIKVSGKSAEQVMQAFVRASELLSAPITLRQLSARAFWGHSKFLDTRERLLQSLFTARLHHLVPRPILLNVALPDNLGEILLVENQDTFLSLSRTPPPATALVYSGGFRGASGRVRRPGGAVFSYLEAGGAGVREQFERWWLSGAGSQPCAFWGDLDWAGIAILQSLKQSFPEMSAWRPGYDPLVQAVARGEGHELELAGKLGQAAVDDTGDQYVDQVLIRCLRESGRGLDQEWYE